jgi:hypothetical protein
MTKRDDQFADYRAELAREQEHAMAMAKEAFRRWQLQMAKMQNRATIAWFEALDAAWDKLAPADLPTLGDGTLPPDEE